ncbi:NAD-dependent epimerase [Paractinoplanes deccanensis]|uniref:NAD-dependent epimerase n=2 Tax=Paractinoplanes deccanensis TaxID=113561 RepID=A0ABQ3Y400_9ACTN|nr:NAD-dependent epimerase [Actinoplanes deccanensis]
MAKVVVFGITGYAGGHIGAELAARGHQVTGVARKLSTLPDGIAGEAGSIHDADFVRRVTEGADHIVVALRFGPQADEPQLIEALPSLIETAVARGARLGFVGGAGSLQVAEGGPDLVDTPSFPEAYKGEALAARDALVALRASDSALDWFYVSPAAAFGGYNPGEKTGEFRVGGDVLLTDAKGDSYISGADFAIAFVDEIESGAHRRARFTVAY